MHETPTPEHQWLEKLVGQWNCEFECQMGSDQAPMKSTGTEIVRSLGGLWVLAEGEGEMPDVGSSKSLLTLGYDARTQRYVGTFICSVMSHLWLYSGSLDANQKVLTLDTEGPNFEQNGMAKYQDITEWISEDHRVLTSQIQQADGSWHHFMTAHYRRTR